MNRKTYRFNNQDRGQPVSLADYKLVCLPYIPLGKREEVEIYLDVKDDLPSQRHHDPPSSRRGKTIIRINPVIHWAWHVLFGNDLIEEAVAKIVHCWQGERGQIKEGYLLGRVRGDEYGTRYDVRHLAYYIFFGDTRSVDEALKIIKETFIKEA